MALKAKIPPASGSPWAFALCCGSTRVRNMWSWTGSGFCWFSEYIYIHIYIYYTYIYVYIYMDGPFFLLYPKNVVILFWGLYLGERSTRTILGIDTSSLMVKIVAVATSTIWNEPLKRVQYPNMLILYKMFLVPPVFNCNLAVLALIKAQLKVLSIQIILILSRQGWQIRFCLTLRLCLTYDILYCLVNGFSN
jgi:hypothetical protein